MIDFDYITGRLAISGVCMNGPAWHIVDLAELVTGPALRGKDRVLPGVPGVVANRRRPDVTTTSLPMVIAGDCDQDGDLYGLTDPDDWSGLYRNLATLRAGVVDPPVGVTRTAVLELPVVTTPFGVIGPAGSIDGDVHVERLKPGKRLGGIMLAVLELTVVDGELS